MNKNNKKQNKIAKKLKNTVLQNKSNAKIAKFQKNLNIQNVVSKKKLFALLLSTLAILLILIVRLFYLQIINGSYLTNLATKQQTTSSKITSKRGNIYDSTRSFSCY